MRTTSYIYNPQGRKVETHFADSTYIKTTYNALGLKIAETDQAGRITHYVYDVLDRQIEVIIPDETPDDLKDNPKIKTEYDELGRASASIDELGNRTEYEYDKLGRQILIRDVDENEITYTYDSVGNRIAQTNALLQTTEFVYDERNRLIETQFTDGTYTTSTYDLLGRVIATTDQNQITTQYGQGKGDYEIGDFVLDLSLNAFFAFGSALLPYAISETKGMLHRLRLASNSNSPLAGAGVNWSTINEAFNFCTIQTINKFKI